MNELKQTVPQDVAIRDPRITHIREVATKGMEIFIKGL